MCKCVQCVLDLVLWHEAEQLLQFFLDLPHHWRLQYHLQRQLIASPPAGYQTLMLTSACDSVLI